MNHKRGGTKMQDILIRCVYGQKEINDINKLIILNKWLKLFLPLSYDIKVGLVKFKTHYLIT